MRIFVSCIPFDSGKSGISEYARETVRALASQGHELSLLLEPGVDASAFGPAASRTLRAPRWTRRAPLSMLWHLLALPILLWRRRREFDGFFLCAANRRVCAFYPLPTVATVHDLANFHVPGKYSRARMLYLAHVLPFFAKRAHRLLAVSESTKADMVRFWHCPPERIEVLYEGLPRERGALAAPLPPLQAAAGGASERQPETGSGGARAPRAHVLYVSRIEHPGKNHVRLIEAYGRLPRALAEAHPLVLAGADWKDAGVVHAAAAASPHADCIRFAGFVSDEELDALWRGACAYVFPSLFEGFGLSLAEAMARGVPCACSENGSLGEIGRGVAETFDPENADAIARALRKLLEEPEADRAARIARGLERAKAFSWERHAAGVAALLREAGRGRARAPVVPMFGIPVSRVTNAEALSTILGWAREGKARRERGERAGPPKVVATVNVDFVANAVPWRPWRKGGELLDGLRKADMVTADGMPIVALSRLLRDPLPERVAGSDLTPAICRACAAEGLRFHVLGGTPEVLAEAFAKLGISGSPAIAGTDSSRVDLAGDFSETVARANASKPDILFVALGNPKQELWIRRAFDRIDAPVAIGVGGSFNFVSGRVKRAPAWVRRCGLEWAHRIVQEPGRLWRRYAVDLVKFSWLSAWLVGRSVWKGKTVETCSK